MDLRAGDVIDGRWTVIAPLGEGANGVVVHARDARGRDVALKWLLEPDSPRVQREIDLARALSHPNIVPLLDSGVHRDHPWLAFELVRGETLEKEIARGPMPVERVRLVACEILRALEVAHAHGVVHRDVKPANVMIDGDRVKLLDFGAARTADSNLTGAGETLGTPRYMAPEQVAAMPIDARTDLYSLGLVLAEAISGKPVYDGALMRVLAQHASPDKVPLPDEVIASPLGPAIMRATQKSPALRFKSARRMRKAIELPPRPTSRLGWVLAIVAAVVFSGTAMIVRALLLSHAAPPLAVAPTELDAATNYDGSHAREAQKTFMKGLDERLARCGYERRVEKWPTVENITATRVGLTLNISVYWTKPLEFDAKAPQTIRRQEGPAYVAYTLSTPLPLRVEDLMHCIDKP